METVEKLVQKYRRNELKETEKEKVNKEERKVENSQQFTGTVIKETPKCETLYKFDE